MAIDRKHAVWRDSDDETYRWRCTCGRGFSDRELAVDHAIRATDDDVGVEDVLRRI